MTSGWDGSLDLVFGSRCLGCLVGGQLLCRRCAGSLPVEGFVAWPTPAPPGLVPPYASAVYDGLVRALVLGHKERGMLALAPALGRILAVAVAELLAATRSVAASGIVLVPVPSRPSSVRSRGHDPTATIARVAASTMVGSGWPVSARPLLSTRPGVVDQAGLDARARSQNLAGSMRISPGALRRLAREFASDVAPTAVICDDVLTTGATAREAQRALESNGLAVAGVATVAATPIRSRGGSGDRTSVPSIPFR